jgi:hypothetical protein
MNRRKKIIDGLRTSRNRTKVKREEIRAMKRRLFILPSVFIGCAIIVLVQIGFAQDQKMEKDAAKPGAIAIELVVSRATVDAIDYEKRTVTVKLPDGTAQTIEAGPEVKNFDQGKVGDLVNTTFVESIAVFIRMSDAPKRAKPGDAVTNTVLLTAKVETIDHTHRTVTLKSPQGNMKTLKVGRDVTNFVLMKEGDHVVVRSTEPLAITGETPPKQGRTTVIGG